MIQLLLVIAIIGLLYFFLGHPHHHNGSQDLPTATDIQNMHDDVRRAKEAADKANQLIKQQEKDIQRSMQEAEK